jgi:acetyl esterase
MPLHPQTEKYLKGLTEGRPRPRTPLKVQDMDAKGVPLRVYSPASEEPLPALLYFHGGGFTGGSVDAGDMRCRVLADWAGVVVVNVGYRLAPANPFPAAVDDAYGSTRWVADEAKALNVDPDRIAVGGDSAEGNLAAVVTHLAKARGLPLAFQYLVYPVTDLTIDTTSRREYSKGYGLDMGGPPNPQYLQGHDPADPLVSPLRNAGFTGLPPAFVATADYDPLRDEGELYAQKLREAGVPVQHKRYPGTVHAFAANFRDFDAAVELSLDSARALQAALAKERVPA